MDKLYTRFDNIFFEKTRLTIMTILAQEGKATFNQLKNELNAKDGTIYTHLEKLRTAGYVEKTRELAGTNLQTVYSITEKGMNTFREYVRFLEHILENYNPEQ